CRCLRECSWRTHEGSRGRSNCESEWIPTAAAILIDSSRLVQTAGQAGQRPRGENDHSNTDDSRAASAITSYAGPAEPDSIYQTSGQNAPIAELCPNSVHRPREHPVPARLRQALVGELEERHLVGRGIRGERRQRDAQQPGGHTTLLAQFGQQLVAHL